MKRARQEAEYAKLRRDFLAHRVACQRCYAPATDVHHKRGRGKWLLAVWTWVGLCRSCHRWAHANPTAARAAGFLERRNGAA